jgi:hypothetical protein
MASIRSTGYMEEPGSMAIRRPKLNEIRKFSEEKLLDAGGKKCHEPLEPPNRALTAEQHQHFK